MIGVFDNSANESFTASLYFEIRLGFFAHVFQVTFWTD